MRDGIFILRKENFGNEFFVQFCVRGDDAEVTYIIDSDTVASFRMPRQDARRAWFGCRNAGFVIQDVLPDHKRFEGSL